MQLLCVGSIWRLPLRVRSDSWCSQSLLSASEGVQLFADASVLATHGTGGEHFDQRKPRPDLLSLQPVVAPGSNFNVSCLLSWGDRRVDHGSLGGTLSVGCRDTEARLLVLARELSDKNKSAHTVCVYIYICATTYFSIFTYLLIIISLESLL